MQFRMNSPEGKAILALLREGDYAHPGEGDAIAVALEGIPRRSTQRVLDVGCGRGGTAQWLYEHGWGNVVGVDVDPVTIEYARGRYPQVGFVNCDVADLSRQKFGPFDLVCLFNSFYAFSDQLGALREIHQVCSPQGRLLLFDYTQRRSGALPALLGREIGRPIVLETLGGWLLETGYEMISAADITDRFVAWYEAFLRKLDANRSTIETTHGRNWYDYVAGWYGALHGVLKSGELGGALVHAVVQHRALRRPRSSCRLSDGIAGPPQVRYFIMH